MENQSKDDDGNETEEFPNEFQCSVCLDLLFKPVVLACGHISCFWCVFKAMDAWQESHCPVCRHPYNHFPSICQLLHFMLLKKYPLVYKKREKLVIEEEKKGGSFSPQFDDYLSVSDLSNEFDKQCGFSSHSTTSSNDCSTIKAKPSVIKDSEETIVRDKDYTIIPMASTCEATTNGIAKKNSILESKLVHGTCNQVLVADLLCAGCKQLLCRPVVLNCGHVYCEACVINPSNEVYRCQICQSVHPNGLPKVCLVLEHFLEEHFSEDYTARKEAILKQADCCCGSPSTNTTQAQQHAAKSSTIPPSYYSSQCSSEAPKVHIGVGCDFCGCSSEAPKVHIGVGCDFCGIYPINGERYKCEDCVEEIGFDLCEECYNSSSKLPGRFNQQHTPEHKFKIVQPLIMDSLIWRLNAELSEDHDSDNHEDLDDSSSVPSESGDASNNTPEDQEGTNSTT